MNFTRLIQQGAFVVRKRHWSTIVAKLRGLFYRALGMTVGNTHLPKMVTTWPHQVAIGDDCLIEQNVHFKYDGIWSPGPSIVIGNHNFIGAFCEFNICAKITIGNDCLIASGCKFIDHNHGTDLGLPMRVQKGPSAEITLGNNVWLGVNVVVLKGVNIGDGAIVGAGAVVTKSIPQQEIWGGIPAKKIGQRTADSNLRQK